MNKHFTSKLMGLAFLLICSVSGIQAQDDASSSNEKKGGFGIRAGVIISNQDFENGDLLNDTESKFGLDLAILYAIPLGSGTFMLQPELHWSQHGSTISDVNNNEITTTLNYLELPVLLRLNFGGNVKLFALAGASAGYLLGGKLEGDNVADDVKEVYDDLDFSGILGLGIGLGPIEIDVRYHAGLTDIAQSGGSLGKITSSSFGAGVSLIF